MTYQSSIIYQDFVFKIFEYVQYFSNNTMNELLIPAKGRLANYTETETPFASVD